MSERTYAATLAAITSGTTVTYGALSRGERIHVQSLRRDGLVVVVGPDGLPLESLAGEGPVKHGWTVTATVRGREVAAVLAPFATGAPVIGDRGRHAATPAPATVNACGAPTAKGTPCTLPVGASGACRVHGSPVVVTTATPAPVVESAPAPDVESLLAGLAALLAGAR